MSTNETPQARPTLGVLLAEVQALLGGASPSTVRRLVADGKFPPPVVIGHARVWPRAALQAWLERQWDALGVNKRNTPAATPCYVREPATTPAAATQGAEK